MTFNTIDELETALREADYLPDRGLATALIAYCVSDARVRAGPVIIGADPNDTPKLMYASMGFRPLYISANYVKMSA